MSSEFVPVNMTRPIIAEDNAYSRQNQYGTSSRATKVAASGIFIPSNDDIQARVDNALQAVNQRGYFPDRGSILNILV